VEEEDRAGERGYVGCEEGNCLGSEDYLYVLESDHCLRGQYRHNASHGLVDRKAEPELGEDEEDERGGKEG